MSQSPQAAMPLPASRFRRARTWRQRPSFNEVAGQGPTNLMERNERKFYTSTPGHNEALINHVTVKLPKEISSHGLPALETNLEHNLSADVFTLDGRNGMLELWQIKRIGDVDVPYWDVKVDLASQRKITATFWNERAEAMMAAIFRMTNPRLNPRIKPRANLQHAPDFNRLHSRPDQ